MIVADSSAVLALIAPDETIPDALGTAIRQNPLTVPSHFPSEIANGLWAMLRRKRLKPAQLDLITDSLLSLIIEQETTSAEHLLRVVLPLAVENNLTVYDAAYLELAKRRQLPFATLDDALRKAARRARVQLV
ncbi:MAG: type II toxin-antitoxin system VapC family toxin [Gammaproteobacteria bacterium]